MDDKERIHRLEEEVAYLRREKNVAVSALETAATLGHFHTSLSNVTSVLPLLEETAEKVRSLIRFKSVAILLVNEADSDFYLAYADPPESAAFFEKQAEALIQDATFSWALQRDKPLIVSSLDKQELLLHSISTASRTRGMLFGILDQEKKYILDTSYALLSIILLSSAAVLESHQLYHYINGINQELKDHVAKLAESECKLLEHRNQLEDEVAERTQDLTHANDNLLCEIRQRKRAQSELIHERDFISAILETAGALVVVLDTNGNIVRFNSACENTSGYLTHEVLGHKIWDLFSPPEERETLKNTFASLLAGKFPNYHEDCWISRSGSHRHISWNNSVILDSDGQVEFVIGTGIDITEKKSAEAALRDSEARFRAVFMMAGIGIVLHDVEGHFLDCNPVFLDMLGYSRRELFALSIGDILHKDDLPHKQVANTQLMDGTHVNLTLEKRYVRKDGSIRLGKTTMTLVRNQQRQPLYFVDMVEDVTTTRMTQDALRQAEQTYRNIFDNSVEGMYISNPHGKLLKANPALARMLGFDDPKSLLESELSLLETVSVDDESRVSFIQALQTQGEALNYEMQFRRRDGRKIWVSISAWTSVNASGDMERVEGLIEDVTERKISEFRLKHKATMDGLTGVPNRYLYLERFEQILGHAERNNKQFAILYLDLDNFKIVNDRHGHHVGDLLLSEAAQRLQARVRASDILARIGGDEFALLLNDIRSTMDAEKVAQALVGALVKPYFPEGIKCHVGVSIGISLYPQDGNTADSLLHNADAAMYMAKDKGGNGYCFYSEVCGKVFNDVSDDR